MTKPTEDWEKERDKTFFKFYEIGAVEHSDKMKPFIRNLLASRKAATIERLRNDYLKEYGKWKIGREEAIKVVEDELK